ncbi:M23 family metallopeptidase [Paraburkholderia sp. BCC1885]|uniref:M23 family metallopeptidase n=1 Tax=Paraburkholderia sp. BCC1885 TaxID=2562669 RepID=UPI0011826FDF|nr:M23 family metallopeptidase [Paraburkholderia sp. BCC1885]
MIISPPFLPESGLTFDDRSKTDPMMDAVDEFELAHGIYPVASDRSWHCGIHLAPDTHGAVHAIADGEVVAYRVCQHAMDSGNGNAGFVLLKHSTETGEGRTLTFYSLYMHLLPLAEYQSFGHEGNLLPEFLCTPSGEDIQGKVTPAAKGSGQKVRRKDVIGYLGRYQGVTQLHFEIFMQQQDFDAYFGHTQLGNGVPSTPTTSDCWGHTYYRIAAGQQFFALPPGTDEHDKLNGIAFTAGKSDMNTLPLVVETYFSKGAKYTKVWSVAMDGTHTLLTEQPVCEADYEYDLYERANALYPKCPSDGYELLRFGRILSPAVTLTDQDASSPPAPDGALEGNPHPVTISSQRTTWVQVTYAVGKQGYIDINNAEIKKLSDADFPSFMGWQKITNGNTPFDNNGRCDLAALRNFVKDAGESERLPVIEDVTEPQHEVALSTYLKSNNPVRQVLRGFICNAPSEWDSTNNETRYAKLLDDGGFYHGNDQGYSDFLKYLKEIQFWDTTGLPAGQKLWFFHPLAFIRHFRKCGWLSLNELTQLLPRRYGLNHAGATLPWQTARGRLSGDTIAYADLCKAFRKYGITTPERQTAFLSQIYIETGLLKTAIEEGQGSATTGNAQYYQAFYGRGLMQLTWPTLYDDYGKFRGFSGNTSGHYVDLRITTASTHYWSGPPTVDSPGHTQSDRRQWYPRYDPDIVASNHSNACDSAGFFWVWKHFMGISNISRVADTGIDTETIGRISVLVNGGGNGYDDRQQYAAFVLRYRGDSTETVASKTLAYARQRIVLVPHHSPTWGASTALSHVYVDFTAQSPS